MFGPAPARSGAGTKSSIAGWGDGETGDFKCLTLSNSSPVRLRSRGYFFESNESPSALRPGSLATAPRYLYLEDFRESGATRDSGLLVLHYLAVVPVAGSSQLTQSGCLLGQP